MRAGAESEAGTVSRSRNQVVLRFASLLLLALIAWSPAILTGVMVDNYAVDIPVWDDFERVPLIEKYENHELSFSFLISAHIEHRILIPRLIILANHLIGDGEMRNEVWVIFLSMLASSACVAILIFRTLGNSATAWIALLLANLAIFTLMQYQNLCWGIQTGMLLPQMFLCIALATLHSRARLSVKIAIAALASLAASFCFTHGLIVWLAVLGWFLLDPMGLSRKSRLVLLAGWTLLTAGVFAFYFHDLTSTSSQAHSYFQEPGKAPPGWDGMTHGQCEAGKVVEYVVTLLGSQFSRFVFVPPRYLAPGVGAFQAGLFALLAIGGIAGVLIANRNKQEPAVAWRNLLPWLALGGFVVATAIVMALGRAHISVARSMSPRYLSITLYLTVAIIGLAPLIGKMAVAKWPQVRCFLRPAGLVVAGFLVALQGWNQLYGERSLKVWNASRWQSLMTLAFADYSPPTYEKRLDFDGEITREQVKKLKSFGSFEHLPDAIPPDGFSEFKISRRELDETRAGVVRNRATKAGWHLTGFADTRTAMNRVPDGLLFTIATDRGERTIVGYAESVTGMEMHNNDWDFEFALIEPQSLKTQTRWRGFIARKNLPPGIQVPVEAEAWAIDFEKMRVFRIIQPVKLDAPLAPQSTP